MSAPLPDRARTRLFKLADRGKSNREIAADIGCSAETVRKYRRAAEETPRPLAAMPFGPGPQTPANTPPPAWTTDQPPPPPIDVTFRGGYHDHTYRSYSQSIGFDGWSIERIRAAISQHDQGIFLESSLLAVTATRFGPVFTALAQAIAPVLGLPRHVTGGTRGLSRFLAAEVEQQLAPRGGLRPSPFFPSTLWGSAAIDIRMMGFGVLQHVYGDADPSSGVRPLYTRRWPTWATTFYPSRRTFVAMTDAGPVDIITGDGKFTLLADDEEPHHQGAIRALALEVLAGVMADQALASFINRYGNPKLWGTMPTGISINSPEGAAMFEAMSLIRGPDGYGLFPNGSTLQWAQLSASQSAMFKEVNDKITARSAGILLGSDGTITSGTGGVYTSPYFWGVRRDILSRLLGAIVRGVNAGHVSPYLDVNYFAAIAETRAWVEPVLSVPLPDPDADARQKSIAERTKARHEIIAAERAGGLLVTQERVDQLSAELGLETIELAATHKGASSFGYDQENGVITINQRLGELGLPPDETGRGAMTVPEYRAWLDANRDAAIAKAEANADATAEATSVEVEDEEGPDPIEPLDPAEGQDEEPE